MANSGDQLAGTGLLASVILLMKLSDASLLSNWAVPTSPTLYHGSEMLWDDNPMRTPRTRLDYSMYSPPPTCSVWPVVYPASSEAR